MALLLSHTARVSELGRGKRYQIGLRGLVLETCLTSEKTRAQSGKGMFPECPRVVRMGEDVRTWLPAFLLFVLCYYYCNSAYVCVYILFLSTNLYDMHTLKSWATRSMQACLSLRSPTYLVTSRGLFNL